MTEALLAVVQAAVGDAYRIERELPAGGMSRLFLAEERSLGRKVVVKILPGEHTSEVSAARFRREIEVTAQLQHPNVLTVLTAGASGNLLFYVMPYVEGESLRRRLDRERQLPIADAVRILQETSSALAYAHSRGVVHRDIKPENILLQQGHAVVADFGIARALLEARSGTSLTATGVGIGTPGYMAPEQVGGDPSVDARADIYSLGVVAYEMVAGQPPFTGSSAHAVIAAHLTTEARPLRDMRLEAPDHLVQAIHRALQKDPDARFQSIAEFATAIAPSSTAQTKRPNSQRYLIGAIAAAAVVGVVLGINTMRGGAPDLSNRDLLAVAPFDVIAPEHAALREGLVDLVSRSLDGAGNLRTVSPSTVIKRWTGRADIESAKAFADVTGAGLAVFGTVVASGADSVQLRATVYDLVGGASLGDIIVPGLSDRVDRLADSLSVAVLRQLSKTHRTGTARLSALGTSSLPALKAFLRGEALYRRGSWDSAFVAYQEAIANDSNFALAWSHGSDTRGWEGGGPLVNAWRLRAGTLSKGLAPRDSIRVLLDSISTAAGGADLPINDRIALRRRGFAMLEEARRRWPADAEFLYAYSEWNFHNPIGTPSAPVATVVAAMEKGVSLDPDFVPVYGHLVSQRLTLDGDTTNALRHADRALEISSDSISNAPMRLTSAIIRGTAGDIGEIERRMFAQRALTARAVMYVLMLLRDQDQVGPRVSRMLVERAARGDSVPPLYILLASHTLAARGHLNEAFRVLSRGSTNELVTQFMALGIDPPDGLESVVGRWLSSTSQVTPPLDLLPWLALRGDTVTLAAVAKAVAERAGPPGSPASQFGPLIAPAIGTYSALARNDTAAAFNILRSTPDSVCVVLCQEMQLIKARLLRERGRNAEAQALLQLEWPELGRIGYLLQILERGRVAEQLRQREAAIDAYSFVMQAWGAGDSLAQQIIAPAREGLKRLGADERVGRAVRR